MDDASCRISKPNAIEDIDAEMVVRCVPVEDYLMVACPVRRCQYWFHSNDQLLIHWQATHDHLKKSIFFEKSTEEIIKESIETGAEDEADPKVVSDFE